MKQRENQIIEDSIIVDESLKGKRLLPLLFPNKKSFASMQTEDGRYKFFIRLFKKVINYKPDTPEYYRKYSWPSSVKKKVKQVYKDEIEQAMKECSCFENYISSERGGYARANRIL